MSIDELEKLSGKKRQAKLDEIRSACQRYLVDDLRPRLAAQLADAISPSASADVIMDDLDPDRQTVLVRYPSVFVADPYVRSVARIECGAKSALDPHGPFVVTPYVAAEIPNLDLTVADVTTILPERTFWDKVVIVHGFVRGSSGARHCTICRVSGCPSSWHTIRQRFAAGSAAPSSAYRRQM